MSVANGWATVIDNVSTIPDWWSDALCKAVTGDGWVRRSLYTNCDVSVLSFKRVIALTSIDAGALRGDLGERLVLVDLEPISETKRRTEKALDREYRSAHPEMLGALFDLVAKVLSNIDTVEVKQSPRMADFARVLQQSMRRSGVHRWRSMSIKASASLAMWSMPMPSGVRWWSGRTDDKCSGVEQQDI